MHYTLRIREPHTHYLEVEAEFPAGEIMLPVWTPGSYLIREYARHVEGLAGCGKIAKNRWLLAQPAKLTYRIYGHELSVRTNWVDTAFALIIPAATFLVPVDRLHEPHTVTIEHPYSQAHTGLTALSPNHYQAADYDQLVDCPIYLGQPAVHAFDVAGRPHLLINEGESGAWDGPASAAAARRIVQQYAQMMDGLPYDRYLFLNLLVEAGGGLEHANSTVLMTSRWAWGNEQVPEANPYEAAKPSRHRWLDLVSHEFFHTWNVKRLRPVELGPFDYERENYTESLWFAEGVTTYYGPLMVRRAGLISDEALLADLSRTIGQVQTTPGRLTQSLAAASFDAWIKLYRPHENSPNASISYYSKGCLLAWLLDARLRQWSDNRRTLDDAVRLAHARFSGEPGFASGEIYALLDEVAGGALNVRPLVEEPGELDLAETLEWFGLRFTPAPAAKPWLGVNLKSSVVESVVRDSPAWRGQLSPGDELIALNGYRYTAESFDQILTAAAGKVTATYSRRGRIYETEVAVAPEPRRVWQLEKHPDASATQRRNFELWLPSY